jgi:hypothetical protein
MYIEQFSFQSSIDDLPVNGRALPLSTRPGTNRSDDVSLVSVGPSRTGSKSNVRSSDSQKSSTAASRRPSVSRGSTSRSSKPIISASKSDHQLAVQKENGIQNTIDLVRN